MSDFLAYFLTYLPTPVRFHTSINFKFYYMVSDFGNTTYLPKNRTSFMDVPLFPGIGGIPCIWRGHIGEYLLSPERLWANTILIPGGRRPTGEGGIGPQSRRTKMVFPIVIGRKINYSVLDGWIFSRVHPPRQ